MQVLATNSVELGDFTGARVMREQVHCMLWIGTALPQCPAQKPELCPRAWGLPLGNSVPGELAMLITCQGKGDMPPTAIRPSLTTLPFLLPPGAAGSTLGLLSWEQGKFKTV
jgi:hypothetical protein